MSKGTDLAGVVGTWVAVALAIVALIGVVTPWILLRESRSERFQAINSVDSQETGYIRGGLKLCNRRKYFRRVKVPMFMQPPKPGPGLKLHEPLSIDHLGSATGWVNLAVLLEAYGPRVPCGDQLLIFGGGSWLPVHRFWILTLGLLGRFGKRKDRGISISQSNARRLRIEARGLHSNHARMYYGLTGKLFWVPVEPEAATTTTSTMDKVYFRLHSTQSREPLSPDPMSRSLLFWLALGCLPVDKGGLTGSRHRVFDLALFMSSLQGKARRNHSDRRPEFFRYEPRRGLNGVVDVWAESMGVDMSRLWCVEKVEAPENWKDVVASAGTEKGDWFIDPYNKNHLHWKADIYCLSAGLLTMPISPKGFLFDKQRSLHEGIFFPAADCIGDLLWAAKSNRNITGNEEWAIRTLYKVHLRQRFGRRQVQAHYFLAVALSEREWTISKIARLTIGILTIMSRSFRKLLIRCTGNSRHSLSITLNFSNNSVTIHTHRTGAEVGDEPDYDESVGDGAPSLQIDPLLPENETTQHFDFATIFPHLPIPRRAERLPFTDQGDDILLAALQASNKCAYFSKPLDSSDLMSLIQRMSDVVCVSARPETTQPHERDNYDGDSSEDSQRSQRRSRESFDSVEG
ncbi:hypothetical protein F52700_2386 [Fusarium sp. NRRL 52700]|nr:hypothetical protein F52700_2386 [Fusarium sp. NRRL 52700]